MDAKHRVFLHFDVNKTIIMSDAASGQTLRESLQNILAEECRGFAAVAMGPWTLGECVDDGSCQLETYADYTRRVYAKDEGKLKRMHFCSPGEPGEALWSRLISMEEKVMRSYFVPSFRRAVAWLKKHEHRLRWRIFFRTFGTDVPDVVKHWNLLCQELGLDDDHRILEDSVGRFERSATEITLRFPKRTISGMLDISEHIHRSSTNLALRDHYDYWAESGEARSAGKLLLVDTESHPNARHIFFDDNAVGRAETNILDVRARSTSNLFVPVPDEQARDVLFVQVDSCEAVENDNYFVAKLKSLLKGAPVIPPAH